jgi:pyrroloquinoline-quinone synthase
VESTEGILPATRFAVEAYVHFVRDRTPLEAIASSLTELFASSLHEERVSRVLARYYFVNPDIMNYFSQRLQQAPRDAGFALDYIKANTNTPVECEAICDALIFKANMLWVRLDALYQADSLTEKCAAAERGATATDTIVILQDLADKGFLTEAREEAL